MSIEISHETIDAIAERVVELLGGPTSGRATLVDAGELARRLKVERSWVYEHAVELGAIRLGGGPRPRLRFDVEAIEDRLRAEVMGSQSVGNAAGEKESARAPGRIPGSRVPLLAMQGTRPD